MPLGTSQLGTIAASLPKEVPPKKEEKVRTMSLFRGVGGKKGYLDQ